MHICIVVKKMELLPTFELEVWWVAGEITERNDEFLQLRLCIGGPEQEEQVEKEQPGFS